MCGPGTAGVRRQQVCKGGEEEPSLPPPPPPPPCPELAAALPLTCVMLAVARALKPITLGGTYSSPGRPYKYFCTRTDLPAGASKRVHQRHVTGQGDDD